MYNDKEWFFRETINKLTAEYIELHPVRTIGHTFSLTIYLVNKVRLTIGNIIPDVYAICTFMHQDNILIFTHCSTR